MAWGPALDSPGVWGGSVSIFFIKFEVKITGLKCLGSLGSAVFGIRTTQVVVRSTETLCWLRPRLNMYRTRWQSWSWSCTFSVPSSLRRLFHTWADHHRIQRRVSVRLFGKCWGDRGLWGHFEARKAEDRTSNLKFLSHSSEDYIMESPRLQFQNKCIRLKSAN